jgi:hypothetical protein
MEKLRFNGEPTIFLLVAAPIILIIYSFIWMTFFLMFTWIGKTILVLLLVVTIIAFFKHAIKNVSFFENEIQVKFYSGKETLITYLEVKNLQEIQQGVFIFSLTVIRTATKIRGKRKFPFYCPKSLKADLENLLVKKKIRFIK